MPPPPQTPCSPGQSRCPQVGLRSTSAEWALGLGGIWCAQASCQPVGTEGPSGRSLSLLPPAKATWASPQASAQDPPRRSCLTPCSRGSPSCLLPWTLVPALLTSCPRETGRPLGDHRTVLCRSLALPPPGPSLGWGEQRGDVTGLPTLKTVRRGVSGLRVQQGPWDGEIRAPTQCTFF